MLIKLGNQLRQLHQKLKLGKDKVFKPLVKILPRWISPNYVTLFRFVIVLVWLPFAFFRPTLIQVAIFFIVYFFDLLDGALARFKNQLTYFGKYFDIFSDQINHITLWILILGLTNYQLVTPKFFIAWSLLTSLFIIIEYFLKNDKVVNIRNLGQFCVRISLWLVLIYEVIQFCGLI